MQALMVLLLYFAAAVVQVRCQPYKEAVLNRVELLSIVTIILTAWLGVVLSQSEGAKQSLSIMIDEIRFLKFEHAARKKYKSMNLDMMIGNKAKIHEAKKERNDEINGQQGCTGEYDRGAWSVWFLWVKRCTIIT